jgi:Arc/MetJ family transcription regulator
MRVRICLDDELVAEIDRRAGPGRRSAFIARIVERALEEECRWEAIEASLGGVEAHGHEWDADPAAWVGQGRFGDARRTG